MTTIATSIRRTVRGALCGLAVTALALGTGATAASAAPAAPVKLRAFAGGDSVALLWEAAPGTTARGYTIYRGDTQIASDVPPANAAAPVRTVRFYDTADLPAGSYQYRVRMTATDGQVSSRTQPVTVNRPARTAPPTVNVVNSNPALTAALNEAATEVGRWYWKFAQVLVPPTYVPPSTVTIEVRPELTDIGTIAPNNTILIKEAWVNEFGGAAERTPLIGSMLHEMAHLLQRYTRSAPDWFIEGVAVYATHSIYNDADTPAPNADAYYTDGYSDMSALLEFVVTRYNIPSMPHELNAALSDGTYTDQFFVARTGRTLNQLWTDMTGKVVNRMKFRSPAGWCVEPYFGGKPGTQLSLAGCWDTAYQAIGYRPAAGGSYGQLTIKYNCLDTQGSEANNGAPVVYRACGDAANQRWVLESDGNVVHQQSGKCLRPANGSDSDRALLELWTCDGTPNQVWSRQIF